LRSALVRDRTGWNTIMPKKLVMPSTGTRVTFGA